MNRQQTRKLHAVFWTWLGLVLSMILMTGSAKSPGADICRMAHPVEQSAWTFWSNEFNGPSGSAVNSANWSLDIGDRLCAHLCAIGGLPAADYQEFWQ